MYARSSLPALLFLLVLGVSPPETAAQGSGVDIAPYRDAADRLIQAALADSQQVWDRMAEMCDRFGPRFSGSEGLERANDWMLEEMRADGLENVRAQPVMVPHWVRGEESLHLVHPYERELPMLGLGGSVATPPGGIRGEVYVVESLEELQADPSKARGRVVLFDVPFTSYGETVRYRTSGAVWAARAGAVASLIRSVTPYSMQTPHTGNSSYDPEVPKIPHAAITVEDAMLLHRMQERGEIIEVRLEMEARTLPDVESENVMAELRGWEYPDEVVVLGGHTDSWDVGQGAMDDAGGVVAAWWAVKLMKELGLRPRRTVRVVGWVSEENSLNGGRAYREMVGEEIGKHILAIESDSGTFRPLGFGFSGSDEAFEIVRSVGRLLEPIGSGRITRGGGGADIGPLMQDGVPGMGLVVDGERYFWYHHTDADTVDKLEPGEMARCVATLAVMAYTVADLPQRLPR